MIYLGILIGLILGLTIGFISWHKKKTIIEKYSRKGILKKQYRISETNNNIEVMYEIGEVES